MVNFENTTNGGRNWGGPILPPQFAYTVDQAAHQLGRDRKFMDRQIKANRIAVKYPDSRPMILHDELMRFLESLPDEKPHAA